MTSDAMQEEEEKREAKFSLRGYLEEELAQVEERVINPGVLCGVRTGYGSLDKKINGLQGGDLFVIAARTSGGKSALAMNMVEYAALECQKPAAVFSLEMSAKMLVQRLLACRANLSVSKLRNGFLGQDDQSRILEAFGQLGESRIYIDGAFEMSMMELRVKARHMKERHGVALIVVDNLHLLQSAIPRGRGNRQLEMNDISVGLKNMAKELDVPVIALAHLKRESEMRSSRPLLSDIAESDSIAQNADIVGLLVCASHERPGAAGCREATLIIAKHRSGSTGDINLVFLDHAMRFIGQDEDDESLPEKGSQTGGHAPGKKGKALVVPGKRKK